jgi:hypothetical protein
MEIASRLPLGQALRSKPVSPVTGATQDNADMPVKRPDGVDVPALAEAIGRGVAGGVAQAIPQSGNKWSGWVQTGIIVAAVLISMKMPGGEGELKYKVETLEKQAVIAERETRLLHQYNMNLQLWFREHGIKGVPSPPESQIDKEK